MKRIGVTLKERTHMNEAIVNYVRRGAFEVLHCRYKKRVGVNLEERTREGSDD